MVNAIKREKISLNSLSLSCNSLSVNKINALDEPRLARETHFSR